MKKQSTKNIVNRVKSPVALGTQREGCIMDKVQEKQERIKRIMVEAENCKAVLSASSTVLEIDVIDCIIRYL